MTLLLTESFEWFPTQAPTIQTPGTTPVGAKWYGYGSGWSSVITPGRTGKASGAGSPAYPTFHNFIGTGNEHATMIQGIALYWGLYGSSSEPWRTCPLTFWSDGNLQVAIRFNGGSISAIRGAYDVPSGGVSLGTSASSTLVPTTGVGWIYLEAKVTLHDTTGTVDVRLDGVNVLSLSGVDTKGTTTKSVFDVIGMQAPQSTTSATSSADDYYCANAAGSVNNDFLGPVKIEMLLPNGNGASSGMTNSAGTSVTNSTYVDDVPTTIDTTNWVRGLAGAKDTYTFADAPETPTTLSVKGVSVHTYSHKWDNTPARLYHIARLSGTEVQRIPEPIGPQSPPVHPSGMTQYSMYETKPGGGNWTVADVNSAEFGVEVYNA